MIFLNGSKQRNLQIKCLLISSPEYFLEYSTIYSQLEEILEWGKLIGEDIRV